MKFAFAGNDATDWTVYADTLVALDEKATEKPDQIKTRQLLIKPTKQKVDSLIIYRKVKG
ncbi:hypothetical protein [Leuconostoc mesenteroides]|uniref:hypothetical protein n=1 Tax=Leuconostoc mesenteroides TaxID=1245 RepID=UPI003748F63D